MFSIDEENLQEHRSQLPSGLDFEQVHEYLNDCYLFNEWHDFTKENIKQDFKIMYPGEYEIVDLEIIELSFDMIGTFKVYIKYHDESEQIMHMLRWM